VVHPTSYMIIAWMCRIAASSLVFGGLAGCDEAPQAPPNLELYIHRTPAGISPRILWIG